MSIKMSFHRGSFRIAQSFANPLQVSGYISICHTWGIHRQIDSGRYWICHLPSGFRLRAFDRLNEAKAFCRLLGRSIWQEGEFGVAPDWYANGKTVQRIAYHDACKNLCA